MRQGCNLQNLSLYFDLPNPSIFTNYEPGIKNLRNLHSLHSFTDKYEFLSMLSIICNNIIEYNIIIGKSNEINPISDIIKLQPLEKIFIEFSYSNITKKFIQKIIKALEFRSKTLKKLVFKYLDFQSIELSFITKLECLKHLDFQYCSGLEQKHCKTLSKKKSQINYFSLWYNYDDVYDDVKLINGTKTMIDYVAGESLRRLDLNVVTLEIIREIKESCPNITFLHIKIEEEFQDSVSSVISLICDLSSLKILNIQADNYTHSIIRILGDCLRSVESLYLSFFVDLISFEYFTINCKANLKNWIIPRDISYFDNNTKGFLECVSNYQKVHNSLKKLGVRDREIDKEELKIIINYLMNQGVNVVSETSIALEMF
ncbi:hypothetical protein C1645_741545 [Glomus cerebriforme]|uniref:F-box domain-containing protein n=1 Tax=Glomus cerebriforme TaxID=658196 RepID=A0A397SH16_9GLOM|nr:hypothetical protein C1645_741545 [Glomus cerebriforme]